MTLNLAYGRKDSLNHSLKSDGAVYSNLAEIADFLENAGADDLPTYSGCKRYDWILMSRHSQFISLEVLPDILLDCSAELAEIRMLQQVDAPVPCKTGINRVASAGEGYRCARTYARLSRYVSR